MKRRLFVLLVAVVTLVSMAAVGCAPASPDQGTTPTSPTTPTTPTTPSQPEGKTYSWTFLHEHPSGTPLFHYVAGFAEDLKAATSGQMTMKVSPGGEIVGAYDIAEALKDGVAECGWGNGTAQVKVIGPVGYLLTPTGLPGGADPFELLGWYYTGGGDKLVEEVFGQWAIPVGAIAGEAEIFCHSNVKLEQMSDFNGVKFRTMGMWAEVLQNNGASVVTVSGSEIYEAAQRGVIDAFEYCPPAQNWPMGFQEIANYVGVPGIHSPGYLSYALVNHAAWNGLPADLQTIFRATWKTAVIDHFIAMLYADGVAMNDYEAYGCEVVTLSDQAQEDIARAGLEICQKYAAQDATFAQIFEHQTAYFKTIRRQTQQVQPKFSLFDYAA